MADEEKPTGGRQKRRDETAELTIGELELQPFEPPTDEIVVDELEEIEEGGAPPPPPRRGLGRPAKPKGQRSSPTIKSTPPPAIERKAAAPPAPPSPPSASPPAPPSPKTPPAAAVAVPPPEPPTERMPKPRTMPPPPPAAESAPVRAPSVAPPPKRSRKAVQAPASETPPAPQPKPAPPPPEELETPAPPAEIVPVDASAEQLRDLCESQLDGEKDPERKARLHYELGRLYEVDLDDPAKAAEHYQQALRGTPDHVAAVRGARRMLASLGRHPALPALFDAEIDVTREPAARARLLYTKGRVMEEHLRQAGPALTVYRQALELDPGNLTVLKAIERGLKRDKAWEPLEKIYEQLANAVADAGLRAAWTAARAHLTETHLADPVRAAALYEAALEADPHATAALANVKRLGAAQQRWPQLVDALKREHFLTKDRETRLAILATIARIQESRLGDADAAVKALEEALEQAPDDHGLLTEVARLHRASGRHAAEVKALARVVDVTDDPSDRARLCYRAGFIHDQLLGDTDRARPWYEKALEAEPSHRAAALALVRIHEQHERWGDAIAVLEARAASLKTPKERAELHHRVGLLCEQRLDDVARATEQHQKAVGLDPDHHEAFSTLTRLLATAARWRELAELYERAIDRAAHDGEAIAWLFRLGGIYEDRLDDPGAALAVYDRILARDAKHLGALHALQRAAERADEHARFVDALRAEAALTKDADRTSALLHRAAVVTADRLGDPSAAARALEELLRKAPTHRESYETLARLQSDAGKWLELVGTYKRLLPLTSTAVEKVRLHHRIGEVQETQLGKDADAIESYRLALQLDPEFSPAREGLLAALERSEAWEELAKATEERIGRLPTARERAYAATGLGALYEEKLGRTDAALASYERAIEAMPLHRPALDARERLLTDAKDFTRLSEVLTKEAELLDDPFLEIQAALRAALILAEQQGAVAPALEAFRPVFAKRPDHVGALLAVEDIYARTRDDAGLAVTYEKMASVLGDPKAKLAALQELARARAASGTDTTAVQRKILQLAPDDSSALEALAAQAETSGESNTQLAMQARLASTASDPTVAAFHQTRVGEILLGDGDGGGALAAFRAALGLDPKSLGAARGLTRAARAARDADAMRQAARSEDEVTRDHAVAVSLLLEAAQLHLAAQNTDGAAEDYERALALDPENADGATGLSATLMKTGDTPRLIELLGRAAHLAKNPERVCDLHLTVAKLQAETHNDVGAAVAAAERALGAKPDDTGALSRLAAYLERDGRWEQAVEVLERWIPKARDQALVDAHLRLAGIAEHHLDDPDRAIRSLRAVLSRDEDREEAIAALVRLERAKGRDEEALRLAKKLISVVKDEDRKADTLAELAELERRRGENAAAASAAFQAIGIQGPSGKGAKVYASLVETAPTHASWDNYTTALMTFLERAKSQPGTVSATERSATYRELARIFGGPHNRPDRAIAALREGTEACPDDAAISITLVRALRELKADDKASAEIRRLLEVNVREPRAWRAMAELVRAAGEPGGAAVVFAPLVILGEATEEEERTAKARKARVADAQPGILGEAGLKQISEHQALDASATALVQSLAEVFAKLEGFDHERWGVTKRDRVRHGDPHPVRAFADRIGLIYGVPEYDLYVVDANQLERPIVLPGSPPVLLVPSSVESARDPVLAFHLARPLALLSRYLHPLDRVDDETISNVLVGAARQVDSTFSLGTHDAPSLEADAKRVAKAIGFFSRGRIHDAATAFTISPTQDIPGWARDIREMAARAAILVTDDLEAALEALGEELGPDNLASHLARFWVSDPAMRFRRAVAQQL